LGDVTSASRLARLACDNQVRRKEKVAAVALEVRYALILASHKSLAARVPSELLCLLLTNKIWSSHSALTVALQVPDPHERIKSILSIISDLPGQLKVTAVSEALTIARQIKDAYTRQSTLARLAGEFAEIGHPQEAVQAAREIADEATQASTLIK